jgi:toxin CcdB
MTSQFDVLANPDPETADSHPYFVVLQHGLLSRLNTRIVAPLIVSKSIPLLEKLMPEVTVRGSRYVIDVTNIGVMPTRELVGPAVENLEAKRYEIVSALDLVFTGI